MQNYILEQYEANSRTIMRKQRCVFVQKPQQILFVHITSVHLLGGKFHMQQTYEFICIMVRI